MKPIHYTVADVPAMWQVAGMMANRFRTQGGVIALRGELGAGKTTLVQGLAAALGVRQAVTSPSFALVAEYPLPGGRRLVHMDLFRIQGETDLDAIGFDEYITPDAIVAIEWPERAGNLLPRETLHVEIALADPEGRTRHITLHQTPP